MPSPFSATAAGSRSFGGASSVTANLPLLDRSEMNGDCHQRSFLRTFAVRSKTSSKKKKATTTAKRRVDNKKKVWKVPELSKEEAEKQLRQWEQQSNTDRDFDHDDADIRARAAAQAEQTIRQMDDKFKDLEGNELGNALVEEWIKFEREHPELAKDMLKDDGGEGHPFDFMDDTPGPNKTTTEHVEYTDKELNELMAHHGLDKEDVMNPSEESMDKFFREQGYDPENFETAEKMESYFRGLGFDMRHFGDLERMTTFLEEETKFGKALKDTKEQSDKAKEEYEGLRKYMGLPMDDEQNGQLLSGRFQRDLESFNKKQMEEATAATAGHGGNSNSSDDDADDNDQYPSLTDRELNDFLQKTVQHGDSPEAIAQILKEQELKHEKLVQSTKRAGSSSSSSKRRGQIPSNNKKKKKIAGKKQTKKKASKRL